ncbi:MAG: ATP synthase F0 subunit C [Planctomycetales bacterium]
MNQVMRVVGATFAVMFVMCAPAMAQDAAAAHALISFKSAGALSAGLVIIGGAMAIGKIGVAAVESMARQPEVADKIQTAMIIAAALIEGVTFFALVVCFMGL